MDTIVVVGAGLDVHKKTVVACVIKGQITTQMVKRTFKTFLHDLEQLRDWLKEQGVTHVAMESTGVYWMPVYRVLEDAFTLVLGNARHMANVPGRKTDASDAEWIATLLRYGLIRANFVPPSAIRQLRQMTRFRRRLIDSRTAAQLRVQKLLESTNIKLGSVASEVFGVSGRLMLAALASGISDPKALADLAKAKLRNKIHDLERAFAGRLTRDEARLLDLQLQVVESLEQRLADVDDALRRAVAPHEPLLAHLQTVPGIGRTSAIEILAEIGTDMTPWPNEDHFVAWAGLAPGNSQTANKRRRVKSRDGDTYLKSTLWRAATSAIKTDAYLARRFGRIRARRNAFVATLAIAHHLGLAIYLMIKRHETYKTPAVADPEIHRKREAQKLTKRLEKLGYLVTCTNAR
ncbi:MAG: IS110 family transposase [Thermoanaerobaculia bacterium]